MNYYGERICLSGLLEEDLPALLNWINERELVIFNAPYHPVSEAHHRGWFEALAHRSDIVLFGIRHNERDRLVGTCQLHAIHPVHRSAELQIRIGDAEYRGRGYGTEAVSLLLRFAFHDLNLNRVYLHVFETNKVAIGLYEKLGFTREGVLRQAAHIDGTYVDVVVMGLLRAEYEQA